MSGLFPCIPIFRGRGLLKSVKKMCLCGGVYVLMCKLGAWVALKHTTKGYHLLI